MLCYVIFRYYVCANYNVKQLQDMNAAGYNLYVRLGAEIVRGSLRIEVDVPIGTMIRYRQKTKKITLLLP